MAITSLTRNSVANPTKYTDFLAGNSQYDVSSMIPIATGNFSNTVVYGFSSIPNTYQDLMLVVTGTTNLGSVNQIIDNVNGGISFTGSSTILNGNGSTATSVRNTSMSGYMPLTYGGTNQLSATTSSLIVHILNYANTSTFKTVLWRIASDANGSGNTSLGAGLMQTTQAINTFNVSTFDAGRYFTSGTCTLYGIKAVGQ